MDPPASLPCRCTSTTASPSLFRPTPPSRPTGPSAWRWGTGSRRASLATYGACRHARCVDQGRREGAQGGCMQLGLLGPVLPPRLHPFRHALPQPSMCVQLPADMYFLCLTRSIHFMHPTPPPSPLMAQAITSVEHAAGSNQAKMQTGASGMLCAVLRVRRGISAGV